MLLIRRSIAVSLLVFTALCIIAMAAAAYTVLTAAGELPPDEIKFQAETILFTGVILVCIAVAAFVIVIVKSRNIKKDLDTIIRQNRLNPASTRDGLLRLGEIGFKLNKLYRQIDEISEKRGLKISALSETCEFLSQNIKESIIIVDVTGSVVQVSRGFQDINGINRSEIVDHVLPLLSGRVNIKTILSRLEKKPLPIQTRIKDKLYRCIPIYNSENEISYVALIQLESKSN